MTYNTTTKAAMLAEARMLACEYLMADDARLTTRAQKMKLAIARAIVEAANEY